MATFARIVRTREQAHEAARVVYAIAQDLILDDKPVRITCGEDEDPISVKQRGFLHAAVFPQIEEQHQHTDSTKDADGTRSPSMWWPLRSDEIKHTQAFLARRDLTPEEMAAFDAAAKHFFEQQRQLRKETA